MSGKILGGRGTPARSSESGMTVMELVAVCVVIGIMALIIMPRMDVALRAARRHAFSAEFTGAHSTARAAAVRYSRVSELHIDAANGRFWVEVDTSITGNGAKDTVGVVHRLDSPDISMTSTRNMLCFDRTGVAFVSGTCQAGDATVTFTSGGKSDIVITSTLGKILR